MNEQKSQPVIFLAFANSSDNPLPRLAEEYNRLEAIGKQAEAQGLCELVMEPYATIDNVVGTFQRYHGRIAIFHYAGHADSFELLLQDAAGQPAIASAGGLAAFIGHQSNLQLIFLNGCSTQPQVEDLLTAGAAVVIATNQAIYDQVATDFAARFYQFLTGGDPIGEAFDKAQAIVQMAHDDNPRNFYALAGQDDHIADRWPWDRYVRPGAETALNWNLPNAAEDPLFGLPPIAKKCYQCLPDDPFRGLTWFATDHAALFFGRGYQIRELYQFVTSPHSPPLLLFYGQSGVGKSSLLSAGLAPRLENSHIPLYLRRKQQGLLGTLQDELPVCGADEATLAAAWAAIEAREQRPLLIILDQVEEVFTRSNQERKPEQELADLFNALQALGTDPERWPKGKLILSFRKEWLSEIRDQVKEYKLAHNEMFLQRLDKHGVMEAILGPTQNSALQAKYKLTVATELPGLIADGLLADPESPVAPTLQFLLTKLWEAAKAKSDNQPTLDQKLYDELLRGQKPGLDKFLDDQLAELKRRQPEEVVNTGLALDLLAFHVTPRDTAETHTREELYQTYVHRRDVLEPLVQEYDNLYLLVDSTKNEPTKPPVSRLAHDALAPLVRERFDESEAPGQRAYRTLKNRVVDWEGDKVGATLDDQDLALVEQGEPGMRARTPDEERLVKASREARLARQQERQRQAEIREQERQQREAMREREIRTRRMLYRIVIAVVVVALGSGVLWGLWEQNRINENYQNDSRLLAQRALQQLGVDPVQSIVLSKNALPSAATPRPYLAQAEFALTQALRTSLERGYLAVAAPPLASAQVAMGKQWIAVGKDTTLRLIPYDLDANKMMPLSGHSEPIQAVEWQPDGDKLLSWDAHTVRIWQGKIFSATQELTDRPACAEWQPHHEQVALCAGNSLGLWSYAEKTFEKIYEFRGTAIKQARWSWDGRWLAAWDEARRDGQTLVLWDSVALKPLTTTVPYTDRITALAWAPDSQALAATSASGSVYIRLAPDQMGQWFPTATEQRIKMDGVAFADAMQFITWGTGDVARLWSLAGKQIRQFGAAPDAVQDIQRTPDGEQLLALLNNGDAQLWDLATGRRVAEFRGHTKRILAAAWREGYLATSAADGTARIWKRDKDVQENEETIYKGARIVLRGHASSASGSDRADVLGVRWLEDGRLLTWGEDGTFRRWEIFDRQGEPLCAGLDVEGSPSCYGLSQAFAHNAELSFARWVGNDTIITTDRDGTAQRVSLKTGEMQQLLAEPGQYPAVLWDPTGKRVLTYMRGSVKTPNGQVRDFATQVVQAKISGQIASAFWLTESQLLISSPNGKVRVIDPATGTTLFPLNDITATITATALDSNGGLAIAEATGLIRIWDTKPDGKLEPSGRELILTEQVPEDGLHWSPDGKRLLVAGRSVVLWDVERGQSRVVAPATGSVFNVFRAALSLDGRYIAIASATNFSVYDADNLTRLQSIQDAHHDKIYGIQWITGKQWRYRDRFGPLVGYLARLVNGEPGHWGDSRLLLLTWGADKTARLWDWESRSEILRLTDTGPIDFAAVSLDGTHIFTRGKSSLLRVWDAWIADPNQMVDLAQTPRFRTR